MSIKNVAVVGASGNLGPSIVQALVDTGFTVTVLTRSSSSSSKFPPSVQIKPTDYTSATSIAAALAGQDAVVSTIAAAALPTQSLIIDEAVKAGVKRFIPSEFGVNTQKVTGGAATILAGKVKAQEQLSKAAAEKEGFSWTGVSTNAFFDWGLKVGFLGFNIATKTATIYDSGNEPFTGTNLYTIGLFIASILSHPAETANRYLDVASFITSQNEILKIFEEETGQKWTVDRKNTADNLKSADEKLARGDYSAFRDYLAVNIFGDGKGTSPKEGQLANKELGIGLEDLRETVRGVLKG